MSGEVLLTLKGHTASVSSVAFSPDGKRLASASEDKTVKVWDATSGQEMLVLNGHNQAVRSVTFSPDGKSLASVGDDQKVKIWGANRIKAESTGSPVSPKMTENPRPAPDPDWDPANVRELAILSGHASEFTCVAYGGDGRRLASAGVDGTVKVWDSQKNQEVQTLSHRGNVWSVAYSRDGKRLASASNTNTVIMWNAMSGKVTHTLKGHTGPITSVAFDPEGKRLASASLDKTVKIWDTSSGQEMLMLKGNLGEVRCVAFSANGNQLATASNDGTAKVWDTTSGHEMLTLKGDACVVFSPDGQRLVSASSDGTVKVWDATNGQEVLTLEEQTGSITSIALSPNGRQIAGTSDTTVRVWDALSGHLMLTLKGHTGLVRSVAYSPDGKRLASASHDGTVRIWGANRDVAETKTNVALSATTNASATTTSSPTATKPITSKLTGMQLALIPQGTFQMGSPITEKDRSSGEGPQHEVQISKPFYLGIYEVTQAEFQQVLGRNPSLFATVANQKTERFPVERVSWFDAVEFCNKLSALDELTPQYELTEIQQQPGGPITSAVVRQVDGTGYRLPTEAEWEYACRANTATPFSHGERLNGREANVDGTSPYASGSKTKGPFLKRPTTVGAYAPNEFGLFDMHGNVWEWCQDVYDTNVYSSRRTAVVDLMVTDTPSSTGTANRLVRGGSWKNAASQARSAMRHSFAPHDAQSTGIVGFRVARPADGAALP